MFASLYIIFKDTEALQSCLYIVVIVLVHHDIVQLFGIKLQLQDLSCVCVCRFTLLKLTIWNWHCTQDHPRSLEHTKYNDEQQRSGSFCRVEEGEPVEIWMLDCTEQLFVEITSLGKIVNTKSPPKAQPSVCEWHLAWQPLSLLSVWMFAWMGEC